MDKKKCSKCGNIKSVSDFIKDKRLKSGVGSFCKECNSKRKSEWYKKNKEYVKKYHKKYRKEHSDDMSIYNKNYYLKNKDILSERYKDYRQEYRIEHADEIKRKSKEWRDNNRDYTKQKLREYYYNNKEKCLKLNKNWKENNRDKYNEYFKDRLKNDPLYALSHRIRNSINKALRNNNFFRQLKTLEILGCGTWEFFKDYIEGKFLPGMTWENRDKWHIDHIIPLVTAVTEEDVYRLNHYTNLQPLWAEDNLKKRDKIIEGTQLKLI